jgi:ATP-binding cassette subfamily B protein
MHFHNNRFGGSLVSQTNKFVHSFERLYDLAIFEFLPMIFSLIFVVIILINVAPFYVIGLLIFVAVYTMIAWRAFKKIAPLNSELAESENKQSGQLADSISNIMAVKSHAKEKFEAGRFAKFSGKVLSDNIKLMLACLRRDLWFSIVTVGISVLLIVMMVGGQVWFGVTLGTLIMIITYTQQIMNQLWSINNVFRQVNRSFGDAYDMTLILDATNNVVDMPKADELAVSDGAVSFESVSFAHADGGEAVFNGLTLEIEPGQRIGLVGRSGSGKTTLTKLLLRFADVQEGIITIDGQNISLVTQESLRRNIAYVPQETTLFHRTIRENIAYGRPNASDDEIIRAAKQANAWEFIKNLPKGLETLTGERGVKLSGGQRQRVAIARAILKDAPILVLDEATASLDTESEKLIQEALSRLMKGRTSIVIAHRLSTVAELDRIVVLDKGKIIEDDNHANLISKDGVYAKLWNRQTGTIE